MRRPSAIDRVKRKERIERARETAPYPEARRESAIGTEMSNSVVERARRLTRDERLAVCVTLAETGAGLLGAARLHRGPGPQSHDS